MCGAYFWNPKAFDVHRVGPFDDRRCARDAQLSDAGLVLESGYWRLPKREFGAERRIELEAAA